MRCGRAQRLMAAAADGELAPRRRAALELHVAGCPACAHELAATRRLLDAVAGLMAGTEVPVALEQAALRRVRLAADDAERRPRWWRLPIPALAVASAAVLVLAVGIVLQQEDTAPDAGRASKTPAVAAAGSHESRRTAVASAPTGARVARRSVTPVAPPNDVPPQLAAQPDLFVDLPLLKDLEKLEHFDAIRTTTLDDTPAMPTGAEPPSNG